MKTQILLILLTLFLSAGALSAEETKDKPWCDENYYVEAPDVITIDYKPGSAGKKAFLENVVLKENMSIAFDVFDSCGNKTSREFIIARGGVLDLRSMLNRKTARVVVGDLNIREAQELIQTQFLHSERVEIHEPKIELDDISHNYLVNSDGFITLGNRGRVYVNGLTTKEIEEAVELHCRDLEKGSISVSVFAYNSKEFYVIFEQESGHYAFSFACTEKSRLRSALENIPDEKNEFQISPNDRVWIARPDGNSDKPEILLNTTWKTITTNPKIYPGDRIFVQSRR